MVTTAAAEKAQTACPATFKVPQKPQKAAADRHFRGALCPISVYQARPSARPRPSRKMQTGIGADFPVAVSSSVPIVRRPAPLILRFDASCRWAWHPGGLSLCAHGQGMPDRARDDSLFADHAQHRETISGELDQQDEWALGVGPRRAIRRASIGGTVSGWGLPPAGIDTLSG